MNDQGETPEMVQAEEEWRREDGGHDDLADTVARKARRKQRARAEGRRGLAHGLGTFGVVGWSVAVPTLLGIALGVWLDSRSASTYSWTLMLMIAGLTVGAVNAWYWVRKESGDG